MELEDRRARKRSLLLACFTMYTLSMSIGALYGFSGVANPKVQSDKVKLF